MITDDAADGHQLARKGMKLRGKKGRESEHGLICLLQKL